MSLLESGRGANGGWTKRQLAALGIAWPPKRGWKNFVVGAQISNAEADKFLALADVGDEFAFEDVPKKKKAKQSRRQRWLSKSPEERQRVQDWHIQRAEHKKTANPKRRAKLRQQLEMLIAERKAMFGDSWRENAPFDIPDGV
jgi:hypothetical protein